MRARALLLINVIAVVVVAACGGGQPPPTPNSSSGNNNVGTASSSPSPSPSSAAAAPSDAGIVSSEKPASAQDAGGAGQEAPRAMTAQELAGDAGASEFKVGGSQVGATALGADRVQKDVQKVLDTNLKAVALCYGSALKRNVNARGRLNLRISVEPDGRVTSAADAGGSSTTDPDLVACIVGTYKKLRFSKAKGKESAVHAIFFGPDAS